MSHDICTLATALSFGPRTVIKLLLQEFELRRHALVAERVCSLALGALCLSVGYRLAGAAQAAKLP